MSVEESNDTRIYLVLKNHEEQYSLWVKGSPIPAGWEVASREGTKTECLQYVKEVWTDMRPLSLRKKMECGGAP
jgi:MbtH protein